MSNIKSQSLKASVASTQAYVTSTLAYVASTFGFAILGLFALGAGGDPVLAAPPTPSRIPAVQALADCRAIVDNPRRLACYDAAAAQFDASEAKGDIVVTDRNQVEGVRRQAFGFALPSLSIFERGPKAAPINEVQLRVESAAKDAANRWIIHLEGGQIWRQIDTDPLTRDPKPGAMVNIHHGSLDSYLLNLVGSNATIRVHRDQ